MYYVCWLLHIILPEGMKSQFGGFQGALPT